MHPHILAVGRAFPPHYVDQDTLIGAFREVWGKRYHNVGRIEALHRNVLVGGRHLALPIAEHLALTTFGQANDAFIRVGTQVGADATMDALERAGLTPRDVDAIWFTSVTGIAAPSIDARLVNRLGFRSDIKRVPIFGLGCVAGAAGIARAADYLVGHPTEIALLLSVELCSLTLQRDDLTIPNLIASGLFGDGAAAVVMGGSDRTVPLTSSPDEGAPRAWHHPYVVGSRSAFYPHTEDVMGWNIGESGFRIVLSAEVPDMVSRYLAEDVRGFLAAHGLRQSDIGVWVAHPGGPKVLEVMEQTFHLPRAALQRTWDSLARIGNLSSASVLNVLADTMAEPPAPGTWGLMLAMGPGFCSELVLLRW